MGLEAAGRRISGKLSAADPERTISESLQAGFDLKYNPELIPAFCI
jgi:hypothetical protein